MLSSKSQSCTSFIREIGTQIAPCCLRGRGVCNRHAIDYSCSISSNCLRISLSCNTHLFAFFCCIFSRLPFSLLQYRSKTPPLLQFGSKISVELLLSSEIKDEISSKLASAFRALKSRISRICGINELERRTQNHWDVKALKNPPPTPGLNSSLKNTPQIQKCNLEREAGF